MWPFVVMMGLRGVRVTFDARRSYPRSRGEGCPGSTTENDSLCEIVETPSDQLLWSPGAPAASSSRRHLVWSGAARPDRLVEAIAQGAHALQEQMPRLRQLHPARRSPPRPVAHDGGMEGTLHPAEITPSMTVRPPDLAHGLSEGAVLEDAPQEMDAAVAYEELAAQLEPDLRLHAGGDYALVSILKCRLPTRSMEPGSGADGDIPSGRSARHSERNSTTFEHTLWRSSDATREGSRGRRRNVDFRGARR